MSERRRAKATAEAATPSMEDYRALALFRYTLRKFLEFSAEAAREVGLTPQQHQALLSIKGYPERETVTVGELAERMLLKHHSTVELVDRLVELGLVKRATDPEDRRRVFLSLTPKSRKLLVSLSAAHLEELRRFRPVFSGLLERLGKD
ncbi:MAG TPA: MarR family transcriptional regulator [Candidatus Cybelea sp.]|nr:MarR family transcriptional regulator [Candidatus Cybelea sp.]